MRCDWNVRCRGAWQGRPASLGVLPERGSILHWTELLPEWRLLNNGHIWSDYAEVAGHGLLLSGYRNSPCQEHGTTRAGDFVFSNSQGKWKLGTGSMRSWGESPGLILAYHISSHRAFTLYTRPQCPMFPMPYSPCSWPQLWLYSGSCQSQAQDSSDTVLDRALGARLTPHIIDSRTCSRSGDAFGKGE